MSDYNKNKFEKEFKKAVPNFNELIAHFEHKSKSYEASSIIFVWNNKLWKLKIHKDQYHIDLWKNHFIEFFNTGEFDYHGYWKMYGHNQTFIDNKIYKIPLCKKYDNDFYEHSEALSRFYKMPESEGIGGKYGFMLVPKLLITTDEIITIS